MWLLVRTIALAGLIGLAAAPATAQKEAPTNPLPSPGTGTPSNPSGSITGERYHGRLLVGDEGPDFYLPALEGPGFSLKSVRGIEAVALLFQQRVIGPLDEFAAIGEALRQRGVRVIFVIAEKEVQGMKPWQDMWVLYDRRGDVARTYGACDLISGDTVPSVYLLDRYGKLRFFAVGHMPKPKELQELILSVLYPTDLPG
jgi:alkyl hydroperoxide reductase subunit AhpC